MAVYLLVCLWLSFYSVWSFLVQLAYVSASLLIHELLFVIVTDKKNQQKTPLRPTLMSLSTVFVAHIPIKQIVHHLLCAVCRRRRLLILERDIASDSLLLMGVSQIKMNRHLLYCSRSRNCRFFFKLDPVVAFSTPVTRTTLKGESKNGLIRAGWQKT